MEQAEPHSIFLKAFKYSMPVFFGYIAIGTAFGLLMEDAGYSWRISLLMSIVMFAGAGQFIAAGLFAAGTGIFEAVLIQLLVNARHIAYGMSMLNRFKNTGVYKYYLIFGLTDETFALLSSLKQPGAEEEKQQAKFMFYVTALNQSYWITGTLLGSITGSLIPFNTEGIGFALTAMFIVLMLERMTAANKPYIFILSAATAVLGVFFLPLRISLLAALIVSIVLCSAADSLTKKAQQ